MIAGTLAKFEEPADEPLESWQGEDRLPALVVDSQRTFDGHVIQWGTAAGARTVSGQECYIDGNPPTHVSTDSVKLRTEIATEWCGDPTDTGMIAAASVDGDDEFAFPFDLLANRAGKRPERLEIDVAELKDAWEDAGDLRDVWMAADDDGDDGTSIDYHEHAERAGSSSLGLGFECSWGGSVVEGVLYRSGYVACYNIDLPEGFVEFVLDELWEYTYVPEDDEDELQQTLTESTDDSSGNGEQRTPDADACEYCGGGEFAGLEPVQGIMLCNVCRDGLEEGVLTIEEIKEEVTADGN